MRRYAWLPAALFFMGVLRAQTSQEPATAASAQPEMTTLKSTFVPGDKTIFFDDFTDITADSVPPHSAGAERGWRYLPTLDLAARVDFPQPDRSSQEFHG